MAEIEQAPIAAADVVPPSSTQYIAVPPGVTSAPNAMRLVRHLGGTTPTFAENPHRFTIPGNSFAEALTFVHLMSASIRWIKQRTTPNKSKPAAEPLGRGRRPESSFKLEYLCPCSGHLKRAENSRKFHESVRCGCKAGFSIAHHIKTNSLRVVWNWQHNHDPTSHSHMKATRLPEIVDQWLKERVDSGLNWEAINNLRRTPDVLDLVSPQIKPEGMAKRMYDRVRYLILTRRVSLARRDPNPFQSLALWAQELQAKSWNCLSDTADSEQFLFAFQSPWQQRMLREHGSSMIMLDSTHKSVTNYFLSDGRKISLYSVLIRDPIVGKGVPIAWAFTASEAE
ncbi:hypothetical protein PGT21_035121 [Puccinia graminis f. sp. tritici]|uniref:MULE transposase domain-containing protein n=1 Tax=Puccinia graminis f. sp. tritici TaxID=56615 RepID=A0A5B0QR09_PUCGR|nr:hypothetical protein PGT21_035121 [Puccinia graminis f. sp. tritici]